MAGARARKLDLSGYVSGGMQANSILANQNEGLIGGILGGVNAIGTGLREKRARDERESARAEERATRADEREYQRSQDRFGNRLRMNADARAEQQLELEREKTRNANAASIAEDGLALEQALKFSIESGMPPPPELQGHVAEYINAMQTTPIDPSTIGQDDPEELAGRHEQATRMYEYAKQQAARAYQNYDKSKDNRKALLAAKAWDDKAVQLLQGIGSITKRLKYATARQAQEKADTEDVSKKAERALQAESLRDLLSQDKNIGYVRRDEAIKAFMAGSSWEQAKEVAYGGKGAMQGAQATQKANALEVMTPSELETYKLGQAEQERQRKDRAEGRAVGAEGRAIAGYEGTSPEDIQRRREALYNRVRDLDPETFTEKLRPTEEIRSDDIRALLADKDLPPAWRAPLEKAAMDRKIDVAALAVPTTTAKPESEMTDLEFLKARLAEGMTDEQAAEALRNRKK